MKLHFDLTPPTQAQMRELVADLSEEERHLLLEHGEEALSAVFSSTRNGRGCIPAACADRPCSKPAQSLKVAPAGRASPRLLLKTISGKFRIHAMAGSERRSFALVAQHQAVYADGSSTNVVFSYSAVQLREHLLAELVGKHLSDWG